jgi:hypothetical protein
MLLDFVDDFVRYPSAPAPNFIDLAVLIDQRRGKPV